MSNWCELETWKISSLRIHSSIKSQGRCHSLLLNTEGRWWQQVGNWEFVWLTLSEGTVEEATMFHQYCDDCTSGEIYRQEWRDCWQETKSLQQRCVEDALDLERERERDRAMSSGGGASLGTLCGWKCDTACFWHMATLWATTWWVASPSNAHTLFLKYWYTWNTSYFICSWRTLLLFTSSIFKAKGREL